ncbi:MIF4G like-domain-containing protein [Amylostereum chailletii]|nr:MIF4G like-domain-containing protein [Amylostereum chailletii]
MVREAVGATEDRRRDFDETPDQKFKTTVIQLGDVDALEELNRLVRSIVDQDVPNVSVISEALRIGLTEQPYKIPYYAMFLRSLCNHPAKPEGETSQSISLGRQILEDLWKGFQAYVDKLAWRETRFCIHFFAHLTVAKVVSPQSMLTLLQSFTAVLDEFGVSHGRAKRAARCAAEGLMRAGQPLKDHSPAAVIEMITGIQTYNDLVPGAKWLVQPMLKLHDQNSAASCANEILDCAVEALKALDSEDFSEVAFIYPQPYANYDGSQVEDQLYDLPSVLVPPDAIELEGLDSDSGEGAIVKKEEWPDYFLRLFDSEVTPDPLSPAGYAARADLLDIMEIFEINRKECSRLLVEYPKWTVEGAFKPRPGGAGDVPDRTPVPGKDWQLESTIIETILGAQFLLPEPPHKPIYYATLITELAKLSPQTVGPAVGKSIRKLYSYLQDGLDPDISRRFSEWFSLHMSNFGFQIPDLALCAQHPKTVFIRRALEYEIRLSYYDRVLKTLPEPFQDPDAGVVPDQAPGPDYDYDDPCKIHLQPLYTNTDDTLAAPYHDAAQSVLNQLRSRGKPEDIMTLLESLKNTLTETAEGDDNIDAIIRSITIQSLLRIGSRSFSHFLNAIERYISLLRSIAAGTISTGGTGNAEAKAHILSTVAAFWKRNRQMIMIVFDKLMQYQIVDPTDVVAWVFAHVEDGLDWEFLKGAIDKANGRVVIATKRLATLRKEEDETRARAMASDGGDVANMEVDSETKPAESLAVESPALTTALKAISSLTREQKSCLAHVLEGFVGLLCPSGAIAGSTASQVIADGAWETRATWNNDQWKTWTTWGWYRHFCTSYSPYLRNYATTLGLVALSRLDGADDEAAKLAKKIWSRAIGQE